MFFGGKYGVEVFDLTADQICNFLEHPDVDQCKMLESNTLKIVIMYF